MTSETICQTPDHRIRFLVAVVRGASFKGQMHDSAWRAFQSACNFQGLDIRALLGIY